MSEYATAVAGGLDEDAATLFAGPGAMRARCRAHAWSESPLGPVRGWPTALRTAISICQSSLFPATVMWGPGLVQVYNDAYAAMIGGKHPGALGMPAAECWFELWDVVGPLYEGVMRTGQPVLREDFPLSPVRGAAAEDAWFTFSVNAITDGPVRSAGLFVTVLETTAQVRARSAREVELEAKSAELHAAAEALAQSETRLRFAFAVADLGPWDLDLVGGGSWRSLRHDQIFGYDAPLAEWTYDDFLAHVHPDDRGWVDARFGAALESATAWDFTCRIVRRADGAERWITARGEPLLNAEGRPVRLIGIVQDVTELREADTALRAAKEEAEAANRAKSEFLAVMSHELRTPLNAIGGYTELLEMEIRGPITPLQREDLGRIQSNQRHLLGLINDVLNYARLETGNLRYDLRELAVCDAFDHAEHLVIPQIQARGLALNVAACPPEVAVRADPEKLRQVLVNLLSNAAKFTDPGGRIEMGCAVEGGTVSMWVRDTGIGIPADRLDSIFEPFVQVRADLTRTAEGTGLGLAISRDLARGMGGDLAVESALGAGSTFTLTLPAAPPG